MAQERQTIIVGAIESRREADIPCMGGGVGLTQGHKCCIPCNQRWYKVHKDKCSGTVDVVRGYRCSLLIDFTSSMKQEAKFLAKRKRNC